MIWNIFLSLLMVIYMFYLEKYLPILYFLIALFLLLFTCKISLYILNNKYFTDYRFAPIFSYSVSCLFLFFIKSFGEQVLDLMRSPIDEILFINFFICFFCLFVFGVISNNPLPYLKPWRFTALVEIMENKRARDNVMNMKLKRSEGILHSGRCVPKHSLERLKMKKIFEAIQSTAISKNSSYSKLRDPHNRRMGIIAI